ncbi:MAG TPA: alpha/beta fold hydrolase [Streptosporangiaceae bacterium]|nr:alpha/beta fold hydrolase [Streptosporangiaceae bacterium]
MVDLEKVIPLSPGGTAAPLFCVHASSGSAYTYFELAQLLGADQPVYGIEAPGFDDDAQPVRSVAALSAEYARALREFRPEGDFVLLGWSVGGKIAFDLAQRLSAAGVRVPQLIMIDVNEPEVLKLPQERETARRFLQEILATMGASPDELEQVMATRADEDTSEQIFQAAKSAGVLPPELEIDLLAKRYAVFRALVEASLRYEVIEPYEGPVTHLIASESLQRGKMRWKMLATNLTEHIVPGSHHSIWTGDRLRLLAELTRAVLASTQ